MTDTLTTETLRKALRPFYKKSKRSLREHLRAHVSGEGPWTVPGILKAYGFEAGSFLNDPGTVGIVELGGGWVLSDMTQYFASIGQPVPTITDVSVDGTTNAGANGGDASVEVALDIQIVGAVIQYLTGKQATIVVLWSQDINTAVDKSASLGHAACSCSWGAAESQWAPADLAACQASIAAANARGTTFTAAAGDNDADDGDGTGKPAVDAPASCSNSLACGGTATSQDGTSSIWNDTPGQASGEGTGGGFSTVFPFAAWCTGPKGGGRSVSDVAGNADPNTGFDIVQGGQSQVVGGTSAVAPLWAGLIASLGVNGPGSIDQKLWGNPSACTPVGGSGTNGIYPAAVCCGLGTPNGANFSALLGAPVTTSPAPPAPTPAPPSPAPPAPSPTCADVVQAIAKAFAPHWLLFEPEAVKLASAAASTLLSATTSPTLEAVDATLAKAFTAVNFRQEAIDAAAEAIDPLW